MTLERITRRRFVATMAGSIVLPPLLAQDIFPSRQIRIITPLPAGGSADVVMRTLAIPLAESLKQPVIVENRPGGQFKVAMNALQSAPGDGHTLMFMFNSQVAVQVTEKLFNLEEETTPIMQVARTPIMLVVRADSPFTTVRELVAHSRANPGKLNFGTLGPGSIDHLKMVQIEKAAGMSAVAVPYRGGPDMLKGLLGGEVDCFLSPGIFAKSFHGSGSGKLRSLAAMGAERWAEFPNVPTMRESGVQVPPIEYWLSLVARRGAPADAIQRLHRECQAALRLPSVVKTLEASAHYATPESTPQALRELLRSELTWMSAL